MDTPELSPNPTTFPVSDAVPWLVDEPAPQQPVMRRQVRTIRPVQKPEMVHWWVVVLTLMTALSVLFGAHDGSRSRELLPVVIVAP